MNSFIEIEFFQDNCYFSGGYVYGTIHLHAKNNLNDTHKIVLALDGEEKALVYLPGKKEPVVQTNAIIGHIFSIYDYTDFYHCVEHGMYSYPFSIYLPENLPQSVLCFDTKETP